MTTRLSSSEASSPFASFSPSLSPDSITATGSYVYRPAKRRASFSIAPRRPCLLAAGSQLALQVAVSSSPGISTDEPNTPKHDVSLLFVSYNIYERAGKVQRKGRAS